MRIPQSYVQKCKIAAHIFQILFIFVTFCVAIAAMVKEGPTGGALNYMFALVRLPPHTSNKHAGKKLTSRL